MKTTFFFKVVALLCTTTLLFACNKTDNFNFDAELAKEQEASSQVNKEVSVSLDEAKELADIYFSKLTGGKVSTRSGLNPQIGRASVETLSEKGRPLMYIMNYPEGGFVIMGATKNYYPILAYSDKNSFKIIPEMGGAIEWLEETKEAIKTSDALHDTIRLAMQKLWRKNENADNFMAEKIQKAPTRGSSSASAVQACLNRCQELYSQYGQEGWNFMPLYYATQQLSTGLYNALCEIAYYQGSPPDCSVFAYKEVDYSVKVGPLLTTKWHQNSPFNDMVPSGRDAGCGAIAIAQVMKYYQYPQSLSLNGYPFGWSNIPVSPNPSSDQAALVRLVGLAVNTHYGSVGSWATPSSMEQGIRNLLFNVICRTHNIDNVQSQLFRYKRPVIMGGNANNNPLPGNLGYIGESHYWVCDGAKEATMNHIQYYTEWQPNESGVLIPGLNSIDDPAEAWEFLSFHFHMNWGWGGTNDGWFVSDRVDSGSGNFMHNRLDFYISKP